MTREQDVLNLIRNSESLGVDSCSTFDECYSDEELMEEIRVEYQDAPDLSPQRMLQLFEGREGLYWENEQEVSMGYGV